MEIVLGLISGVAWTLVYIQIIRQGNKDKFCGMPLWALSLNITWEILYFYRGLFGSPIHLQTWVNLVWAGLDLVIVYQYLKYNNDKFGLGMTLLISTGLQIVFLNEFISMGPVYSAFLQNLLMSGLFVSMLKNNVTKGQNIAIAVAKWVGTLAPTMLFGVIRGNSFVVVVGLFCSLLDLVYVRELKMKLTKIGATI